MTTIFSLFPPTDHGKVIKTVNAESADSNKKVNSVVIEELDVLTKNEPIRNLEIVRTTTYGEYANDMQQTGSNVFISSILLLLFRQSLSCS